MYSHSTTEARCYKFTDKLEAAQFALLFCCRNVTVCLAGKYLYSLCYIL